MKGKDIFGRELMTKAVGMKSAAALMAAMALSACQMDQKPADDLAIKKAAPSEVESEITKVANSINTNLRRLTEIEAASKKVVPPPMPSRVDDQLRVRVSVLWKGPAETILAKLADEIGYSFKATGKTNPVPLMVAVDVKNEPVVDVLRSIGAQMGDAATVNVSQRNRVVEVVYAASN